jgi:hypothetical protein
VEGDGDLDGLVRACRELPAVTGAQVERSVAVQAIGIPLAVGMGMLGGCMCRSTSSPAPCRSSAT